MWNPTTKQTTSHLGFFFHCHGGVWLIVFYVVPAHAFVLENEEVRDVLPYRVNTREYTGPFPLVRDDAMHCLRSASCEHQGTTSISPCLYPWFVIVPDLRYSCVLHIRSADYGRMRKHSLDIDYVFYSPLILELSTKLSWDAYAGTNTTTLYPECHCRMDYHAFLPSTPLSAAIA